ncbi:hypothetical protein EYF80_045596 [Liparis tanakae]|uniref:Uncharacterized protein n=1 Tax=Liparis tanakae TaxID=230148 RepID=A0A4Z2FT78_9TELE|nr:hypothetical protein EYF80_045596 [Liparis tanakae]
MEAAADQQLASLRIPRCSSSACCTRLEGRLGSAIDRTEFSTSQSKSLSVSMAFFTVFDTVLSSINLVTWEEDTHTHENNQNKLNMYIYTHLQGGAMRADLFEGVHLGGEVGRFEHAQQRVEPQVVHHGDEFPLEPHAQQLDGRQQVRDAHQTLKGDARGAAAWARHG